MDVSTQRKIKHYRSARYFTAWRNYDMELLKFIFTPDAKYIIRNKKRVYNGIQDITAYWSRNKRRQQALNVHWHIVKSGMHFEIVEFTAFFQDVEKWEMVKVNGQIIFEYNAKNKITVLTEAYRKSVCAMTGREQGASMQILEQKMQA